MFRSILVPLDVSTFGEHALPMALELARKSGATLHLTHVLLPLGAVFADAPPFVNPSVEAQLRQRQQSSQQAYLEATATRLRKLGAPVVTTTVLDGDIPEMLHHQVEVVGADLVVMATHGHGPFTRFWLGSVADALMRSLTVPLLLVRPGEDPPDLNAPPPLGRVLVPLDGSPLAEKMVEPAGGLAKLVGAEMTLLRTINPLPPPPTAVAGQTFGHMMDGLIAETETLQEKLRSEAQNYLRGIAATLEARGLSVRTLVEADNSPAAAVLRHAGETDLVALATHGYGGLKRLFLGSVADKVIRGAHIPVMVCRPKG
jgi:nucleotide-binding universal stress UspA family protein